MAAECRGKPWRSLEWGFWVLVLLTHYIILGKSCSVGLSPYLWSLSGLDLWSLVSSFSSSWSLGWCGGKSWLYLQHVRPLKCPVKCPLPVPRALVRLWLKILSSLSRHKDFSWQMTSEMSWGMFLSLWLAMRYVRKRCYPLCALVFSSVKWG